MRARTPAPSHAATALLVLLLAALVGLTAPSAAPAAKAKPRLKAFRDCSSLIRYGNRHVDRFSPRGAPPAAVPMPMPPPPTAGGEGAPTAAPAPVPQDAAGDAPDVSGTNVQEAGVDEPDTIKTDGRAVYAIANGRLQVVDVTGATPRVVASLDLGDGYGHQLLRRGDRLLVLAETWGGAAYMQQPEPTAPPATGAPVAPMPPGDGPRTHLVLVDVSDPSSPTVLRTLDVDARLVAARMTGPTARVVLDATPRAIAEGLAPADLGGGGRAVAAAKRTTRRRANAWLPAGTFTNARTDRRRKRALIPCRSVRHPRSFSGLGTLTVLTIDPREGLEPVDADGLMSSGETVYASEDDLYVATRRYRPALEERTDGEVPDDATTEIHRFETPDEGTTVYRGSGRVPGFLLSQFSLSEHEGVLRVASTEEPPWFSGDRPSQSTVTTLKVVDGGLPRLGAVGGLGKGERIYAVRFIEDAGYVVTFRQVDPLYAIDLSAPADPRVRGELKILGYSAYLHPAGEGRLIGVGQDATEEGRRLGTQVQLFDVSDLSAPSVLHKATVGPGSSSAVEWDHHAFLWWAKARLAVIPVALWEPPPPPPPGTTSPDVASSSSSSFVGALAFRITDGGIGEAGRIAHGGPSYQPAITRSLVVGDRLFTLSDAGLMASRLDTLGDVGFAPF